MEEKKRPQAVSWRGEKHKIVKRSLLNFCCSKFSVQSKQCLYIKLRNISTLSHTHVHAHTHTASELGAVNCYKQWKSHTEAVKLEKPPCF